MDRDAQLREALRRAAAEALEHAYELGRNAEEQIGTSRRLCAQLHETALRVESERRLRQVAARNRQSGRQ